MEYELGQDEPVSFAIVEAVSSAERCPPGSLPPLYETLDPDALDTLFASEDERTERGPSLVTFAYSDSIVTVEDHDTITVEPQSESTDSSNDRSRWGSTHE